MSVKCKCCKLLSAIEQFQKISIPLSRKRFFSRSPTPLEIAICFIHVFKCFSLREPPTPQEIPILSMGASSLYGTAHYYYQLSIHLWNRSALNMLPGVCLRLKHTCVSYIFIFLFLLLFVYWQVVPYIKISIYVLWFTILMECNINFMNGTCGLSRQIIWGEFLSNSYHSIWSSFSINLYLKKEHSIPVTNTFSGNRRCGLQSVMFFCCILLYFLGNKDFNFIIHILFKIQYCEKYTQNIERISKNYYMCIMAYWVYRSSCYKIKCYKMMHDY